MPKTPEDMSAAAVERRAGLTAAEQEKAKIKAAAEPAAPKIRIAKKR